MATDNTSTTLPSLALLLRLFDSLNEVICVFDLEGRFVYVNNASFKLWGYYPEELVGTPYTDLLVEEDRDISIAVSKQAYAGAPVSFFENRYRRKDGQIINMIWEGGWDLTDQLMYSTGRDISERKRLEKLQLEYQAELKYTKDQLESLLERITDGFIGIDENGKVVYWNKAAESITHITQEQIVGKALWDVVPEPMRSIYLNHYTIAKAENRPMSFELFSERLQRWIAINTYVSGSGLSVFFQDVTEKKRMQEQLLQEKEYQQKRITAAVIRAAEAERAHVGKELHDNVNQVLTTVKLYNELCLSNTENAQQLLAKSTQLLQDSINEIRGLSKRLSAPSLGGIRLKDSIAELVEAINVTNRLSVHYEHNIEDLEVSNEVHIAVYRILQEHFTNIIKHAKAKVVNVKMCLTKQGLEITVTDNGKGFDTTQYRKGIGVENMNSRADGINASLEIKSAPGEGCVLHLGIASVTNKNRKATKQ